MRLMLTYLPESVHFSHEMFHCPVQVLHFPQFALDRGENDLKHLLGLVVAAGER